ncbi:diacylglycerol kinase family protein [Sphaerobacter sp.]|uniref:diacylglycerol/lipid kinase family protein n=1 Tax=Sphaerobacter sp. TaxID=2099654 RepID=UPI0025E3273A|nr:diacylglycerol kinase family protein [Sphaerobacter sp.]
MNPCTGRREAHELEAMLQTTLGRVYDVRVLRTSFPGAARDLARQAAESSDVVLAVGGDGTVGDVASGLVGTNTPLAIIPTGSANAVARSLGIPLQPAAAARLLVRPHDRRTLDVARAGDRVVVHMAGSGYDALVMRDAQRSLKRLARWLAYVPPALKHLTAPRIQYRVTVDGETTEFAARMVLIANGAFVLDPWLRFGDDIRPDDGVLDVCVFDPPHLAATLTLGLWFLVGHVGRSRFARRLRGRSVRVEASPPAPVELDGDYAGTTPLEMTVCPAAIQVIVPRGTGKPAAR